MKRRESAVFSFGNPILRSQWSCEHVVMRLASVAAVDMDQSRKRGRSRQQQKQKHLTKKKKKTAKCEEHVPRHPDEEVDRREGSEKSISMMVKYHKNEIRRTF